MAPATRPAFSLVELLVVITVIVMLLALLAPAMDTAIEQAQRAVCGANLHAIQAAMTGYAVQDRKKEVVSCLGKNVQIGFDANQVESLATVGLAGSSKIHIGTANFESRPPAEVWNCPSRAFRSAWENQFVDPVPAWQLIVGYQYLGGLELWRNPQYPAGIASRSPRKLNTSGPGWVLAADATFKALSSGWGLDRASAFGGMPSHKRGDSLRPDGGNQAHMDGSVAWFAFEEMLYIHGWNGDQNRKGFWRQTDLGFEVTNGTMLPANN